ncbi:hypothetical protein C7T94_11210 [Pedobacter yulinensis]|uniref:DUF5689 domain-containing protein n=1 Tax=Pedobacter yulinensis TaxID=2126353 RepID=A0A2T3HL93_9SPHI|nr:BACON domain-containing carbohydrate-binding protein [Pedobacter yulinensis]PST83161.1 hypothetical protein C7T94_11210 [Pedobacter yulinensis]
MKLFTDKQSSLLLGFVLFCAALFQFACQKDEFRKFSTDLALNSKIVRVADSAGSTRLQVYADGNWDVSAPQDAGWLKFDRNSGSGKGEFLVSFTENHGNLPRAAKILISAAGKTDTISLQQRGITPALRFADDTMVGIGNGGEMKTLLTTNVPFELMKQTVSYQAESNWITGLKMDNGFLKATLAKNTRAEAREGKILLSYLDAFGTVTRDSILVSQNPKADYDSAVLKDFAYVKSALAAGTITEDIYVEGVVVSDKGNPNMGLNPNKSTNKHEIDKAENALTVYVQSNDGKSGLHIRTKTAGDNVYGRFERVKIWLKGVVLRKETNPARVMLDQVPALNIMAKDAGTPVPARAVYMKDLKDDDLYTYVKLRDVEISIPSGSYFNVNEGYNMRTDAYPMNIRDINGSNLYMITNIDVPYRRNGKRVPQGSGDISGILVHEKLQRYGTNIGPYSIRHVTEEDIALQAERQNGFSNVLVEWSRFKTEFTAGATAARNPLTPDVGTGTLTHSEKPALDFTTTGIFGSSDYNGLIPEASTVKGAIENGAFTARNWWNTTKNRGSWWLVRVSTKEVSKPISLQVEGHNDIGGPRNFVVEWSATGEETSTWNVAGEYTLEDVTNWSNTLVTQVPGMKAVNFQFPQAASGLDNLYIRLRVKNRTVGTATSPTAGTLAVNGLSRLSHLSIKYNK